MSAKNSCGARVLLGRLGAYTILSRNDPYEVAKAARKAFLSKFERDVDPDGVLPLEERMRRIEMARKAHLTRLALASAKARRKRTPGRPPCLAMT
jgi:hypothetical protein